ncbi:MAG: DUF4350 domain-containing protein [Planctomycetes bacterium]|nr:DUF4350 domain-containing protein [Planctomycetota bacterium]
MNEPEKQRDDVRSESRLRWVMVGIVGGAMLLYFIVSVFRVPLQADTYTNSYSTSPGGHTALIELLRKSGREVTPGKAHLDLPAYDYDRTDTLAMLEPGMQYVDHFEEEFKALFEGARGENTSIVIAFPKRHYSLMEAEEGGDIVLEEELVGIPEVQGILGSTGFERWLNIQRDTTTPDIVWAADNTPAAPTEVRFKPKDFVQVFKVDSSYLSGAFDVMAATQAGDPVILRYRANRSATVGGVLLVSDPDLLTNRFIAEPGAAEIATRLFALTPQKGTVLIDEDLHGFSTEASLEYLAVTPPGLWVSLSVSLLLLIFAWRQATVLRPRAAEPQDRRARKFSIDGLARMMERAGEHDAAHRRIVKRSRLVLGGGRTEVQGAGMTGTRSIQKGKTGRITRIQGGTSEERLINAARKVAYQKRTGETEHNDLSFD